MHCIISYFLLRKEAGTVSKDASFQEMEQPIPSGQVKGGYNLDFLDNLDDPNFNPFETKTKVVELFGDSKEEDIKKDIVNIAEETKPFTKKPTVKKAVKKKTVKPAEEGEKAAENKQEKPKKVMPPKPWLMKKQLKLKNMEPETETNEENGLIIDIAVPPSSKSIGLYRFINYGV